jgi:S-adenosylmethionine decarboxylase
MEFKAKEKGYDVTAIFSGVNFNKLNDYDLIKNTSLNLLKSVGFNVLDSMEHKFSPQGYTFVILLAESHFAVHTYPEYNTIYFHLYTCGDKDSTVLFSKLKEILNPTKVVMKKNDIQVKF